MLVWAVCPQNRLFKNLTGKFNEWAKSVISGDLRQPLIVSNVLSLRYKAFNSAVFQVPYKDPSFKYVRLFFCLFVCFFHSVHMFRSEGCSAALSVLPFLVPQEHLKKIFSNISNAHGKKENNG